jgi:Protein of unknown function (DUF3182)
MIEIGFDPFDIGIVAAAALLGSAAMTLAIGYLAPSYDVPYDGAMRAYKGFMASRRNYDVGRGIDAHGRRRLGVFESSWRAGGASSAELLAVVALASDPEAQVVAASHVEQYGSDRKAPPDAIIHFDGDDPEAGPVLRYTVLTSARQRLPG